MEYGESAIQGGVIDSITCSNCGAKQHSIKGIIKYVYFFIESLPFFPVKKTTIIQCVNCQHVVDNTELSSQVLHSIKSTLFKFHRLITKFTGIFLIFALLGYFLFEGIKEKRESQIYINAPQKNDFYFVDYRKLSDKLRPNQKYRVAKIIDITGDNASIVFGSVYYAYQHSLESSIRKSRVATSNYFERKRVEYTFTELKKLYASGAIIRAMRPIGNKLFDTFVVASTHSFTSSTYYPGSIENNSGLAFLSASYIEDHEEKAFAKFKRSAEYGYAQGQNNLAELYLTGRFGINGNEKALYWFKQSALQSNKQAIDKYLIICNIYESCDANDFYQALTNAGVNYRLKLSHTN